MLSKPLCTPGQTQSYVAVYPHLDWLRKLLGDERCILNAPSWRPEKFARVGAHLSAIVLATLSTFLIVGLIINGLQKQTTNSAAL